MTTAADSSNIPFALEAAAASHPGTRRQDNEDFCGHEMRGGAGALVAVADGVSGMPGGEVASRMAVEATLRAFNEQPATMGIGKRLWRAVQRANMEVYDFQVVVTDLRGMGTTLTAIAIEDGELAAAHVGDSRLYLVRNHAITQLTKDHTVVGDRVRLGLLSEARARHHPDRSTLTRCLGRELIVGLDRFTRRVAQGDALVLCSDGLYNALDESEIARLVDGGDAHAACEQLIAAAVQAGAEDNVTVAIVRMVGPRPAANGNRFLIGLRRLLPARARSRAHAFGCAT